MHGQFSAQSRLHPAYETAQARDREQAQSELQAFLIKAEHLRVRIIAARIIEPATTH